MNDENVNPTVEDDREVTEANAPESETGIETTDESAADDQRAEYVHDHETMGRDYRVEGNDVRDYIGVDPEYMTYANETDAPILTDTERFLYTNQYDHLEGNADEDSDETDGEDSEPGQAGATDGDADLESDEPVRDEDKDAVDQSSSGSSEKSADAPFSPFV